MKKYLLDLPVELHSAAKARAAMEQISLKELIIRAVKKYLKEKR
jgi:predicted HicB family RNase H-like nuclease